MHCPVGRRWLTILASVFAVSVIAAHPASAAIRTWDGGGALNLNYNWANTANWTTGVAPVANDSLVFTGNKGNNANTNNIAAGTQFNGITFNSGAASFSLDGNAITLGGTVTNNSTNTQTITLNLALTGGPQTFNAAGGNLTVSGTVSGTFGLVKSGPRSLTLSDSNTYSGGTTLNSGTLVIGNANALGSGTVATAGGSVVAWSGNDSIANVFTLGSGTTSFGTGGLSTLAGSIGGTGSLRKFDVGTLALAGDNTYTGATSVAAGTLAIGSGGTTGSVAGDIVNNSAVSFNRSDSLTYSGSISGNGSVNKRGGGTLTLAGNNTFSGGITLWGGTLALGSSGALGNSGTISFGGGTLQFSASNTTDYSARFSTAASQQAAIDTNGQSVTLATPLTSAGGSLTKSGGGTLTLAGDNTYTGLTTVSAGTLAIGSGGTTGWVAGNIVNNAAVTFNRSDDVNYSGLISGTGTLTKMGSAVLKLTGTASGADRIVLDFATNVSAGGLQAVSADVTGTADLRIGNSGTGTLNVTGGSVISRAGSLGFNAGGVGTATVSSGTWGNSSDLNVGHAGTGTLDVTGGSVFNVVGYLGAQIGGVG
ncbi:MAG: autotransporter-associated beta strand repeat-containing protein, partial [Planctomycetes bacterium]|nr:autotransporter-associated beta strand repeat-containing protein [Planctomycetota bacterium]